MSVNSEVIEDEYGCIEADDDSHVQSRYVPTHDPARVDDEKRHHNGDGKEKKTLSLEECIPGGDLLRFDGEKKEDWNRKKMENRQDEFRSVVVTDQGIATQQCDHGQSERKNTLNSDVSNKRSNNVVEQRLLSPPSERSFGQKPGIILLGRGNSFSLGRSEVILLHNRPKSKSVKDRKSKNRGIDSTREETLVTINERRFSVETDEVLKLQATTEESGGSECGVNNKTVPSPSPPPVSNGLYHPDSQATDLNGDHDDDDNTSDESSSDVIQLVPCYEDDLQNLWLKAESMMTERNDRVQKILEEFGIGQPGGGGGEDEKDWEDGDMKERKREEEEVWQIIQES